MVVRAVIAKFFVVRGLVRATTTRMVGNNGTSEATCDPRLFHQEISKNDEQTDGRIEGLFLASCR